MEEWRKLSQNYDQILVLNMSSDQGTNNSSAFMYVTQDPDQTAQMQMV